MERRRILVDTWREEVEAWESFAGSQALPHEEPAYVQARWFASLRPHLTPSVREQVEHGHVPLKAMWHEGERVYRNAPLLYAEIDRLEREWKLV